MLLICINDVGEIEVQQRYIVELRRAFQKRWYLMMEEGLLGEAGKQHVKYTEVCTAPGRLGRR